MIIKSALDYLKPQTNTQKELTRKNIPEKTVDR